MCPGPARPSERTVLYAVDSRAWRMKESRPSSDPLPAQLPNSVGRLHCLNSQQRHRSPPPAPVACGWDLSETNDGEEQGTSTCATPFMRQWPHMPRQLRCLLPASLEADSLRSGDRRRVPFLASCHADDAVVVRESDPAASRQYSHVLTEYLAISLR
jgi:hypothetical protein